MNEFAATAETGVVLRFLAAFRRAPLTLVKDQIPLEDERPGQLRILRADVAAGRFREDRLSRLDLWSFRLPGRNGGDQ